MEVGEYRYPTTDPHPCTYHLLQQPPPPRFHCCYRAGMMRG